MRGKMVRKDSTYLILWAQLLVAILSLFLDLCTAIF